MPLIRAEVLGFRDRYPDADSIQIRATGSAEGMEMLVNGEVSMSLLLRDLTDPEADAAVQREGMQTFPIAWDAVAVIVNPASPIEQLSRTELGQIYGGKATSWAPLGWRQGGEIIALTAGPRWGIFAYLEQALLGGGSYAPGVYAPPTEEEVVEVVATRRNAIACVSRPYAEQAGSRVRMLRVSQADGLPYVALDRETLLTKTYPLLRSVSSRHRPTRGRPPTSSTSFRVWTVSVLWPDSGMRRQPCRSSHSHRRGGALKPARHLVAASILLGLALATSPLYALSSSDMIKQGISL